MTVRGLFGTFLLLCSLPVIAAGAISIGVIGDQTLSAGLKASYDVLQRGVAQLSRQNVKVVPHALDGR
jgi:hypothetical protein